MSENNNLWPDEAAARNEIKDLVARYYKQFKSTENNTFAPGDRINYASRVFVNFRYFYTYISEIPYFRAFLYTQLSSLLGAVTPNKNHLVFW